MFFGGHGFPFGDMEDDDGFPGMGARRGAPKEVENSKGYIKDLENIITNQMKNERKMDSILSFLSTRGLSYFSNPEPTDNTHHSYFFPESYTTF